MNIEKKKGGISVNNVDFFTPNISLIPTNTQKNPYKYIASQPSARSRPIPPVKLHPTRLNIIRPIPFQLLPPRHQIPQNPPPDEIPSLPVVPELKLHLLDRATVFPADGGF